MRDILLRLLFFTIKEKHTFKGVAAKKDKDIVKRDKKEGHLHQMRNYEQG